MSTLTTKQANNIIISKELLCPSSSPPPELSQNTIDLFIKKNHIKSLFSNDSDLSPAITKIKKDTKNLEQKKVWRMLSRGAALFFATLAVCMIVVNVSNPHILFLGIAIAASLGFVGASCWAGHNFFAIRRLKKSIKEQTEELPKLLENFKKHYNPITKNAKNILSYLHENIDNNNKEIIEDIEKLTKFLDFYSNERPLTQSDSTLLS